MPNHCANDLRINGKREDIDGFFAHVSSRSKEEEGILIDADQIIPYPEKFKEMDRIAKEHREKHGWENAPKDGYNNGGYEWCVENWGTKWGLYSFRNLKHGKNFSTVTFDTAWSPPTPVIQKASEQYPYLTFTLTFFESGCQYKGRFMVRAGEVLCDKTEKYNGNRGG